MLIFFSSVILVIAATLWGIWKCRNVAIFEGRVVNAFQALNYCRHMVSICQEGMDGNHFLRSCKPTVCIWIQFVDCLVWQVLFLGEVDTKRNSCQ
jgi:hypothetical protein